MRMRFRTAQAAASYLRRLRDSGHDVSGVRVIADSTTARAEGRAGAFCLRDWRGSDRLLLGDRSTVDAPVWESS